MCLDLHHAPHIQRLEEMAIRPYLNIAGHGAIATRNVTNAERFLAHRQAQQLRTMAHGGGFSSDKWPHFIGEGYKVNFTEVVLVAGEVPSCKLHKIVILMISHDFPTLVDHTTTNCAGYPPLLGYAYGGLAVPQLDVSGIYEATSEPTLKIVSYNIWNLEKPYETRMQMIAHQLIQLNPHIIGLQEVRLTNYEYPSDSHAGATVADLAHKLYSAGYEHWVWRPAMLYEGASREQTFEGLALFSQYPILDVEVLPLTRENGNSEDYHQRIALRVELDTAIGRINAFVTHFSLLEKSRDENCVELRDWMYSYAKRGPVILMGDLNAERSTSKGIRYLLGETSLAASTGFLKDSFDWILQVASSDADVDESLELESVWTFTTLHQKPKKRIDFVLYNPTYIDVNYHSVVENDFKDSKTQPSDHRAVYVEFRKL